jgi:hypothetical protein
MNRRLLLLSLFLCIATLVIKIYMVQAQQQELQVGTPVCMVFDSNSNPPVRCARTRCSDSGDSFSNYTSCSPDPSIQDKQICETKPSDCLIVSQAKCIDSKTVGYTYVCPDSSRDRSFTETIDCPVTCKKCLTKPNAYGLCPTGYTKNSTTGCCDRNQQVACYTKQEYCMMYPDDGRCSEPQSDGRICMSSPILAGNAVSLTSMGIDNRSLPATIADFFAMVAKVNGSASKLF